MLSSLPYEISLISYEEAVQKDVFDKDCILMYPLINNDVSYIQNIIFLQNSYPHCKILIIDFNKNKKDFFYLSNLGIDGYILGTFTTDELIYSINKLSNNQKFYDRAILYLLVESNSSILSNNKTVADGILTHREIEILLEIARGLSNIEISSKLKISENTVKKHISNIFLKINVKDRTQAAIYAYTNRLLD